MRSLWRNGFFESAGLGWVGVGVAALLLLPSVRRQLTAWGQQVAEGLQDVYQEARQHSGLIASAAAVVTAGAAVAAAPEAGTGAVAAAAVAPAVTLPLVLGGLEQGFQAKRLVEEATGEESEQGDEG